MAPRIRVNKLGEPLMPVTGWVPVAWLRPITRMAQAEQMAGGKSAVVEVAIREALDRRGLLGDADPKVMRREVATRNSDDRLAA